jgi:hypothetical protein
MDYQIAERLVELARQQGPHTWVNAKYLAGPHNAP